MSFLDFALLPGVFPHTVALSAMGLMTMAEALALIITGASISGFSEGGDASVASSELGSDAPELSPLDVLRPGGLPISVGIILALFGFGASGFILHAFIPGFPGWASLLVGGVGSWGTLKILGPTLAKFLPKDETYALTEKFLIGQRATVILGTAERGSPTQARVKDWHGRELLIMVEPGEGFASISSGESCSLTSFDAKRGVWEVAGKPKEGFVLLGDGKAEADSIGFLLKKKDKELREK